MAHKIIMTRGLPGSGKTTWAKQYQALYPGTVRTNKDELRAMCHDSKYSRARETLVCAVRDFIVDQALSNGQDCIVDDTNFSPKHRARMEEIAAKYGATVEVISFIEASLEDCIARDLKRPNSVGERVIRQMYRQYVEVRPDPPLDDADLPDAIICDLDGTLALFGDANPYDRDFSQDAVNEPVRELLRRHAGNIRIFILSGRKETAREQTWRWLKERRVPVNLLYMRPDNDTRRDVEVKEDLYNQHIKGKYNVVMVIDDRLQVCRLWHRLGLPLFRVGDPDADF